MRWRAIRSILVKELTETLRDRRTLFAMIVLPVLLQPVLLLVLGQAVATDQAQRKALKPNVVYWGVIPPAVESRIEKDLQATVMGRAPAAPASYSDRIELAEKLIAEGNAHLVIWAEPGAAEAFAGQDRGMLHFFYDPVRALSQEAHNRAVDALDDLREAEAKARSKRFGHPEWFWKPLYFVHEELASKEQRGGDFASHVLPIMLLLMVMLGAVYPAIDVTAGEKERGTLQTLLCAPVKPVEIVAGKYLSVVAVALVSAVVNLAAMGFALGRQVAAIGDAGKSEMAFTLGVKTFAAIFATLVPAAFLLAALLLALAVFARSFREAQNYITPLLLCMVLPGIVANIPGVELGPGTAFVPVLNIALMVRDLLKGQASAPMFITVLVATGLQAALAILFAARVFESEQVLLGGEKPWRDIWKRKGPPAGPTPTPGNAILFTVLLAVVAYYGSMFANPVRLGLAGTLLLVQLGLLLTPALLWVRLQRFSFRETLSLRLPTARGLVGSLLLAGGGWAIGHLVTLGEARLFPAARTFFEELEGVLGGGTETMPLALAVGLIALLPAIAEEVCFRGVVLSGLSRTGSRAVAIGGSALAFGALHLSPYHIIPTAAIGLVLGFATLESGSLLAGLLVHFVNNALAVVTHRAPPLMEWMGSPIGIGTGCVLAVIGLVVVRGSRRAESPAPRAPDHA